MTWHDGLLLLGAYLLGAVPFGYIITRLRTGADIRTVGSGNIGATNVTRTQGKTWGVATLALDAAKASAAALACVHFSPLPWMGAAGGAMAVVGHCYPIYIGFRGGKGVASGLGAFLVIAPFATLIALGVFVLVLLGTRRVAAGSVLAALAFAVALFVLHFGYGRFAPQVPWIGLGLSLLLVARHHENIRRIAAGTEPPMWGKGGGKP
jgi:acyl phosphate:glycerol-3-phosphate acyltransferase